MKTKHINSICKKFNIPFTTLIKYSREHKEDIDTINMVFDLKGNDNEKILALLYMLSLGEEDDSFKKFCEQTGFNGRETELSAILEKNKILLAAALIYNDTFYFKAVNYKGFVGAGLAVGETEKHSFIPVVIKNDKYEVRKISNDSYRYKFSGAIHRQAAAGTGNFTEFHNCSFTHDGINGTLHFMGNNNNEAYFEFVFEKFQNIIPFELQLFITTTKDRKEHPPISIPANEDFIVKDREKGITILRSDIISGVDYSEGIEPGYSLNLKSLEDF
jgi:hypothetical protein